MSALKPCTASCAICLAPILSVGSRDQWEGGSSLSSRTTAAFILQRLCHKRSHTWVEEALEVVPVMGGGWLGFESVDFHLLHGLGRCLYIRRGFPIVPRAKRTFGPLPPLHRILTWHKCGKELCWCREDPSQPGKCGLLGRARPPKSAVLGAWASLQRPGGTHPPSLGSGLRVSARRLVDIWVHRCE